MKITKSQLKQIIKEEIQQLSEMLPLAIRMGQRRQRRQQHRAPGLENYSKDAIDAATYALKRVPKWATGAMIESEIHYYLESLSSSGKELDIWKIADEALSVAGVGPNEY